LIRKSSEGSKVFMGSFLSVDFGGLKYQIGYQVGKNNKWKIKAMLTHPEEITSPTSAGVGALEERTAWA
jgi:hypothetical protein